MAQTNQAPQFTLEHAFQKLKQSITPTDAHVFQSTELKDIRIAAEDIEKEQRKRQSVRNMARLKPLLDVLEKYSRVIEVLCNGTPYMPYVWVSRQDFSSFLQADESKAPIKLMLQVSCRIREETTILIDSQLASGYTNVFDRLLDAYVRIAEVMPQFDRLRDGFENEPSFQAILALVYADILEFHRRAYKLFRRRG